MGARRRTDLRVDLAGELKSTLVGGISAGVLLHGMADQPQTARLAPIHHPGSEDQLLGQRGVDEPGEALGTTCTAKGRSLREGGGRRRTAPTDAGSTAQQGVLWLDKQEPTNSQPASGNPAEKQDLGL